MSSVWGESTIYILCIYMYFIVCMYIYCIVCMYTICILYIYIYIKQNTLVGRFFKSISSKFQYCQAVSFSNLMYAAAAAATASLQSCPTLCDSMDGSPPGSAILGILQARTLEWVAIPFSNAWKWKVKVRSLSCVRLLVTAWTTAYQAPLSMGFSRQEYWSGLPLPSPNLMYRCNVIPINIPGSYFVGIEKTNFTVYM